MSILKDGMTQGIHVYDLLFRIKDLDLVFSIVSMNHNFFIKLFALFYLLLIKAASASNDAILERQDSNPPKQRIKSKEQQSEWKHKLFKHSSSILLSEPPKIIPIPVQTAEDVFVERLEPYVTNIEQILKNPKSKFNISEEAKKANNRFKKNLNKHVEVLKIFVECRQIFSQVINDHYGGKKWALSTIGHFLDVLGREYGLVDHGDDLEFTKNILKSIKFTLILHNEPRKYVALNKALCDLLEQLNSIEEKKKEQKYVPDVFKKKKQKGLLYLQGKRLSFIKDKLFALEQGYFGKLDTRLRRLRFMDKDSLPEDDIKEIAPMIVKLPLLEQVEVHSILLSYVQKKKELLKKVASIQGTLLTKFKKDMEEGDQHPTIDELFVLYWPQVFVTLCAKDVCDLGKFQFRKLMFSWTSRLSEELQEKVLEFINEDRDLQLAEKVEEIQKALREVLHKKYVNSGSEEEMKELYFLDHIDKFINSIWIKTSTIVLDKAETQAAQNLLDLLASKLGQQETKTIASMNAALKTVDLNQGVQNALNVLPELIRTNVTLLDWKKNLLGKDSCAQIGSVFAFLPLQEQLVTHLDLFKAYSSANRPRTKDPLIIQECLLNALHKQVQYSDLAIDKLFSMYRANLFEEEKLTDTDSMKNKLHFFKKLIRTGQKGPLTEKEFKTRHQLSDEEYEAVFDLWKPFLSPLITEKYFTKAS